MPANQIDIQTGNICTYIRAVGVISILLCHLVLYCPNTYIRQTGQLFGIGVQVFFILSGFLFGRKGIIHDKTSWYFKRVKRIYIPWWIFVTCLLVIHVATHQFEWSWQWLRLLLGVQGTIVGITGAGHTWFVSSLIICYLFTPVFEKIVYRLNGIRLLVIGCILYPFLSAFLLPSHIFYLLCPLAWYGIAYGIGAYYRTEWINHTNTLWAILSVVGLLGMRLLVRKLELGELWYNEICVSYTNFLTALGIILIISYLVRDREPGVIVQFVSNISYEYYLYHYVFCAGPICLFGLSGYWSIDALIITMSTMVVAYLANKASTVGNNGFKSFFTNKGYHGK